MAGFSLRGHLLGAQNPILENLIITDSQTVTVGDAVDMTDGFVTVCDADDRIYGIVVGLVDKDGVDLNNPHVSYSGTYTDSTNTYVAANDNEAVDKVKAVVCPDPYALWYNDSDATLTTAMLKEHFSLVDEDQVDGDSNHAAVGEMQLWKLDPDEDSDASKGLFRISCSQLHAFEPELA